MTSFCMAVRFPMSGYSWNHGVVTVGPTLKDALYAAVYLEDACRSYCAAKAMGTPRGLTEAQVAEAVESFRHYGQGKK